MRGEALTFVENKRGAAQRACATLALKIRQREASRGEVHQKPRASADCLIHLHGPAALTSNVSARPRRSGGARSDPLSAPT